MLIAAYAHDWGYANLFTNGKLADYDTVANTKNAHMEVGAKKLKQLLTASFFCFLNEKQKNRAIHLVKVHDQLDKLNDPDEIILLEADTLGAMDIDLVKSTFDKKSNEKYIQELTEKRLPKFITEYSIQEASKLIKKRKDYYD